MSRQLTLRTLAFLQASLLLAMILSPALVAAATIQTDLFVYQNGDTVNVTGDGFSAAEAVDFVTTDPNATAVDSGTATTDASGNVAYAFVLNATLNGIYTIVGTGESSGLSASTQFDPAPTLVPSPGSVTYGATTSVSGANYAANHSVTIYSSTSSNCNSGLVALATTTTNGSGAIPSTAVKPASVSVIRLYADDGAGNTKCVNFTVNQASTTTSGTASNSSIYSTQSFTVGYTTSASAGVSGNTATGNVSIVQDTGPTSVNCTPGSVALSQAQTAGGFSQSGATAFSCTPSGGAGTYTFHVHFADTDGNYNNSDSSTVTVTVKAPDTTNLTESLTPNPITYGQSTSITGTLTDATSGGSPIVSVTVSDNQDSTKNDSCNGNATFVGSDLTDSSGDYIVTYRPNSVITKDIQSSYAGDAAHTAAQACATLTVNAAPTQIVNAGETSSTITTATSTVVSYEVESKYGITGNTATGTMSIVQDSGPGVLVCSATSTALSSAQTSADGSGADDSGFAFVVNAGSNATLQFTCSSTTQGAYTFHAHFADTDGNYSNSNSGTFSLAVTSADNQAPSVAITLSSPNAGVPNGSNGWFVTGPVTGSVNADDTATGGSAITAITCSDSLSGTIFGSLVASGSTGSKTLSVAGDGTHLLSCTATDSASNTSSGTNQTVKIDSVAPDTVFDSTPANPSNDGSPSISFHGTDGGSGVASFECSLDGSGFTACSSPDPLTLTDGSHTFAVEAIDSAGNVDPTPASYSWVVDTTAPGIIKSIHAGPTFNNGTNDFVTSATTLRVAISESGSGLASCTVSINGPGSNDTSFSCVAGNNDFTLGGVLTSPPDGSYTVSVSASDHAGNSGSDPMTVVLDDTAPTYGETVGSPSYGSSPTYVTSATNISVLGTDTGSGIASCTLNNNGGGANPYVNNSAFNLAGPDGSKTYTVVCADNLGNTDTGFTASKTVDNTAPAVGPETLGLPTYTSGGVTYVKSSTNISVAAGDTGSGLASCTVDTGSGPGAYTQGTNFHLPAPDGAKTYTVVCTDNLGNTSAGFSRTRTVDDTAPTYGETVGSPSYGSSPTYVTSATNISVLGTDTGSGIASCTLNNNGGGANPYVNNSAFNLAGPDGSKTYTVVCADNLGNTDTGFTASKTVDNTAPAVGPETLGLPTYTSGGVTYVKSSTNISVAAGDTGSGLASCTVDTGSGPGAYTQGTNFHLPAPDGAKTYTVVCTDNLGNTSAGFSRTRTVDDTAPTYGETVGSPSYGSSPTYVTSATNISVLGTDTGSGIASCTLNNNGGGANPYVNNSAFNLAGPDGSKTYT